jgi:hypothetical protein
LLTVRGRGHNKFVNLPNKYRKRTAFVKYFNHCVWLATGEQRPSFGRSGRI